MRMFVFGKGKDKEKQHCKNTKVKAHKRRPGKCQFPKEIEMAVQEEKLAQTINQRF